MKITLKLDIMRIPYIEFDPPFQNIARLDLDQSLDIPIMESVRDPDSTEVEINE